MMKQPGHEDDVRRRDPGRRRRIKYAELELGIPRSFLASVLDVARVGIEAKIAAASRKVVEQISGPAAHVDDRLPVRDRQITIKRFQAGAEEATGPLERLIDLRDGQYIARIHLSPFSGICWALPKNPIAKQHERQRGRDGDSTRDNGPCWPEKRLCRKLGDR